MKKFLSIDIGNRHPHAGLWNHGKLETLRALSEVSPNELAHHQIYLSCVSTIPKQLENIQFTRPSSLIKSSKLLRMPIHYSEMLGEDRLSSAYSIFSELDDDESATIIDSGTFITIDRVSKKNGFEGGFIMPGIQTFLQSYGTGHLLPGNLNSLNPNLESNDLAIWPNDTHKAIWGGLKIYLEGTALKLKKWGLGDKLVISGGDYSLWKSQFHQYPIETSIQKHLVHSGLYKISREVHL